MVSHHFSSYVLGLLQLYSLKKGVVGLVVSEHVSLVVVCLVRKNSISLNWRVWLTYVLRQLRRPRL